MEQRTKIRTSSQQIVGPVLIHKHKNLYRCHRKLPRLSECPSQRAVRTRMGQSGTSTGRPGVAGFVIVLQTEEALGLGFRAAGRAPSARGFSMTREEQS
jgi:hypothetical protein